MNRFSTDGRRVIAALVLILCGGAGSAAAQTEAEPARFLVVDGDTLWLAEPLEIVGSRVPAALPGLQRQVSVLTEADLERSPGRSLPEKLQGVPGVVVGQRQQFGVQSDLTMRGSTFEQVQVLLDGYDMSDPQTGHHLFDLPVGEHDIGRLEVLTGHGSAQYGSGAFGGTLNVVTRRPAEHSGGEVAFTGGGEGLWAACGALDLTDRDGADGPRARLSFSRLRSDGTAYATGAGEGTTAAEVTTLTQRLTAPAAGGDLDLLAAYAERDFGAPGFYAPYPSRERTRTAFAGVRWIRSVGGGITLEPRLYGRRHEDRFVLLERNPDAYTNNHATRRLGAELRAIADLGGQRALAVGWEAVYEDIVSTGIRGGAVGDALGRHLRRRAAVSVELDQGGGPWRWQVGGRLDGRSDWDPRLAGTAAVSRDLREGLVLQAGWGTVFRVPTFTDLYYDSPTSRGDPDLRPETGWAWDLGLALDRTSWRARLAWFERHEDDLIEWARPAGATVWQVTNVAEGTVRGVEADAEWIHPRGHRLAAGGMVVDKEITLAGGFEGRYALLAPELVLTGAATLEAGRGLSLTLTGRHVRRTDGPDGFRDVALFDGRCDWRHRGGLFASVAVTNLADRDHQEVPGVPLPGRLASVTVGRAW